MCSVLVVAAIVIVDHDDIGGASRCLDDVEVHHHHDLENIVGHERVPPLLLQVRKHRVLEAGRLHSDKRGALELQCKSNVSA